MHNDKQLISERYIQQYGTLAGSYSSAESRESQSPVASYSRICSCTVESTFQRINSCKVTSTATQVTDTFEFYSGFTLKTENIATDFNKDYMI